MTVPVRYERVSALYPIQRDDRASAIVNAVHSHGEKHDGKPIIKRHLTSEERGALTARKQVLVDALQAAKSGEIKSVVVEMLLGFNKTASRDEAAAIASQYIKVLQSLPLWAIKRACAKFERGESIDGLEGIAKMIVDSKGPTTAQLYPVAKKIADDHYVELHCIRECLIGVVPLVVSPEEREFVRRGLITLSQEMKSNFSDQKKREPFFISDEDLRRMYPTRKQDQPCD